MERSSTALMSPASSRPSRRTAAATPAWESRAGSTRSAWRCWRRPRPRRRGGRARRPFVATFEAVSQAGRRRACRRHPRPTTPRPGGGRGRAQPAARAPSCRCTSTGRWPTPALAGLARSARGSQSSRTPARRTARLATDRPGQRASRGRVQLLSGEEPGRDRRRRRARHRRRAISRRRVRALREHGQRRKYEHVRGGIHRPARHDAGGSCSLRKLPLLDRWNADSGGGSPAVYAEALDGVGDLALPPVAAGSAAVWHLYVVRSARATRWLQFLAEPWDRHRPPLSASRRTSRRPSLAWVQGGLVPGASASHERCSRCRSSRG